MWVNSKSFPIISAEESTSHKPQKLYLPPEVIAFGAGMWSLRFQTNSGSLSSLLYENCSHFFSSSFFVAFGPGLLLLATPLLFQTTLPSRGFCTRWGFRKSLCQLVRASAQGSRAAFHSVCGFGQKELGSHMSLCTPNKLLISWLVESLEQEMVWRSQ